ncbi:prepilin peptidase [Bacillus daqingensis]|uniref:Prepilin peptidase n=1 Tax=Bacillus daqingensis TaxID=872396 RepID=A0ABV9NYY1_9BACI
MLAAVLITMIVICVITDWRKRKIYNAVLAPALGAAFILHGAEAGAAGVGYSFLGLLAGMGLLLIPYLMKGIGAGDVKMLGVIGALMGPGFVFSAFLYTALIGGVIAAAVILIRYRRVRRGQDITAYRAIPYGIPIALGAACALVIGGGVLS